MSLRMHVYPTTPYRWIVPTILIDAFRERFLGSIPIAVIVSPLYSKPALSLRSTPGKLHSRRFAVLDPEGQATAAAARLASDGSFGHLENASHGVLAQDDVGNGIALSVDHPSALDHPVPVGSAIEQATVTPPIRIQGHVEALDQILFFPFGVDPSADVPRRIVDGGQPSLTAGRARLPNLLVLLDLFLRRLRHQMMAQDRRAELLQGRCRIDFLPIQLGQNGRGELRQRPRLQPGSMLGDEAFRRPNPLLARLVEKATRRHLAFLFCVAHGFRLSAVRRWGQHERYSHTCPDTPIPWCPCSVPKCRNGSWDIRLWLADEEYLTLPRLGWSCWLCFCR